jgi:hypothetical protein
VRRADRLLAHIRDRTPARIVGSGILNGFGILRRNRERESGKETRNCRPTKKTVLTKSHRAGK